MPTIDDIRRKFPGWSEAFIRTNAAMLGLEVCAPAADPASKREGKRIRQHQGDGCNKWEREYWRLLETQWSFIYREVSLPLANGLRYKLDFLVVSTSHCQIEGHEVKGMARSTGIAKVKMAARLYPWIRFKLVTKLRKKDGGGWQLEEVRP